MKDERGETKMKKIISMIMMLVLVFANVSVVIAAEGGVSTPNEKAKYYNETTYYTKDALANLPAEEKVKPEGETGELVAIAKQKVYVVEVRDKDGNVKESRLMNKEEADKYKKEKANKKENTGEGDFSLLALSGDPAYDTTSKGELTIKFWVFDRGNGEYSAYGDALWTNGTWVGTDGYSFPDVGDDFLAITWGGSGSFKQYSKTISGNYQHDQGSISFSQAKADSYAGYCWQFAETKSSFLSPTYFADEINSHIVIKKTYPTVDQNKETAMKLTYVHTYQKTVGSINFGIDSKGVAAAGVTLTNTADQWQIEVDISGLEY